MARSADHQVTVAIIGAGEMGSAVGRRLRERGARVMTELKDRSASSRQRVGRAGLEVIDDDQRLMGEADFVLSIVPPAVATQVAERFRGPLANAGEKPVFVECNAVSPATVRRVASILERTGCRFVDAGIIGGPPSSDAKRPASPRFYASGPDAPLFARLADYGIDIAVMDGPVGAASGLKLAYAGLTKGITALGAAMVGAAARDGVAPALRGELARTQPDILSRLERLIPGMFGKAYRWVAEMEQIGEFVGGEGDGAAIYQGAARLYQQIAMEVEDARTEGRIEALRTFCVRR